MRICRDNYISHHIITALQRGAHCTDLLLEPLHRLFASDAVLVTDDAFCMTLLWNIISYKIHHIFHSLPTALQWPVLCGVTKNLTTFQFLLIMLFMHLKPVVKVISHKATLPPATLGTINSIHNVVKCALPSNRWLFGPMSLPLKEQLTHTHPFNGPFLGLPRWAGTRKVKPIWILLKQATLSGSDISWAICKSAPRSRQITMPAPHHSVFLQAGCPSCHPTNSVKALKATEGATHSFSHFCVPNTHTQTDSQTHRPRHSGCGNKLHLCYTCNMVPKLLNISLNGGPCSQRHYP